MKFSVLLKKRLKKLRQLSAADLKAKGLSTKELDELEVAADPILWCEHYLRDPENPTKKLKLRHMQHELLKATHPKIVIRTARRTGKSVTIAARALYQAFMDPRARILILAPYVSQTTEIFDAMAGLLTNSPIQRSIKRSIAHPYFILEFKNGSSIKGMPVGGKLSRRGSPVRGQGAKYLYLDEFDYIPEEIIATILIILQTQADTELWVSSTPSGSRAYFFKWCTESEKNGFEAHYFGKDCIPNLTQADEEFYLRQYGENDYKREVLGDWGEELVGVFRHQFIDESLLQYNCNNLVHNPENKYVIGVDWNTPEIGTRMVVLEYILADKPSKSDDRFLESANRYRKDQNKSVSQILYPPIAWADLKHKYRVFRVESIEAGEFTQTVAIERIIQYYYAFQPEFICVDAGYGETQVELMRKYALEKRDKKLAAKIIPYNFASNIEVIDPLTRKPTNKRFKPLMVNISSNVLESENLILPLSEDESKLLVGQMREYKAIKTTISGDPIYSQGNDHSLDAFMLAVFGFEYNFGDLSKNSILPREPIKIGINPKPLLGSGKTEPRKVGTAGQPQKVGKLAEVARIHGLNYNYKENTDGIFAKPKRRRRVIQKSFPSRRFTRPSR